MSVRDRSALWNTRRRVFIHPPPPPPPPPKMLGVTIPHQAQSNWCWVAVGSGIASYYDGEVYPQCYVVTLVFTAIHPGFTTDCCSPTVDASQQPCNGESGADQALDHPRHHFAGNVGPLDWAGTTDQRGITDQIDQGRPFAAEISWANGGAHFAAITGYAYSAGDPSVPSIYVQDPFYGPSWYMLGFFSSSYQGSGSWTSTTLSQP
jgi:Papain-like cysteine protease AvrRpt2